MKKISIALVMLIGLWGCKGVEPGKISELVFQRKDVTGANTFTVRLRSTPQVSAAMLDLVKRTLTIRRAASRTSEELSFWNEPPMALRPDHHEIQIELIPSEVGIDAHDFVYDWPESFQISRPGVLEVTPGYENIELQTRPDARHG